MKMCKFCEYYFEYNLLLHIFESFMALNPSTTRSSLVGASFGVPIVSLFSPV